MSRLLKILIFVCAPIFLGAALYYIYCPDALFVSFIDSILSSGFHRPLDLSNVFIKILRFYLLDFLWGYALMSVVAIIFDKEGITFRCFLIVIAFEILIEILQISPGVKGTFDFADICVEILAGIIVCRGLRRRKQEK